MSHEVKEYYLGGAGKLIRLTVFDPMMLRYYGVDQENYAIYRPLKIVSSSETNSHYAMLVIEEYYSDENNAECFDILLGLETTFDGVPNQAK